ncbi:hypothetical protein [Alloalcanivorax xenomutans]|uniref:hypothetical protein n=1 Tax=Alloalcanivorax xenomutans TaxID=1094342 RepID=UPI0024E277E1|nr:hypothetical protein [Alloalcanivorax xenomutans]
MSLKELIQVDSHYTRSVNIERDKESLASVKAYIPTSRALRTLSRFLDAQGNKATPRAWSLVGPYGSGKSAFALFLSKLLAERGSDGYSAALSTLEKADEYLGKEYSKLKRSGLGYLEILVTGSPEPLGKRLLAALSSSAEEFWSTQKGAKPKVLKALKDAEKKSEVSSTEIIALVKQLQDAYLNVGGEGILFVIDELGKFLEYEARHYGANDIYLLQSLAEHAYAGHDANVFLFVLLHQSFEQYAKGLGENLKNEWSKVQGRFEEIPFLESSEQVLRVVSAALKQNFTDKDQALVKKAVSPVVRTLFEQDALPASLSQKEAEVLFQSCYPLHPVSAILLPLLCQKIAQNERTLFSYLGSNEDHGFNQTLNSIDTVGELIGPDQVFDYFITNQSAVMGDYLVHRRWAEVVTALDRLGDASENETKLLKTIGLLNIIGIKGGLKASKDVLAEVVGSKSAMEKAVKELRNKSIVNYRRFSGEFRVWQGSDFDLESALQEELNNLGNFRLVDELNRSEPLLPVVARRYTIESGALRYFRPYFVDAFSYKRVASSKRIEPKIIFYIAAGQDDERLFFEEVVHSFSSLDIVAFCLTGPQIREAVAERQALERVQVSRQELNTDAVAKREFEDRLFAARQAEKELLIALLEKPVNCQWFYNGEEDTGLLNKRKLQEFMSWILQDVYAASPIFHNELINRDRPSSQANTARNKLLAAMLNDADKEDLNIDKFPAEKAIYRALLRSTKLHMEQNGEWGFVDPPKGGKANLGPVWQEIADFLASTEKEGARSFAELNECLMAPPYGVKAGVLPILYVAVFLRFQHELAMYENGQYRPHFTNEMVERFVKRPDEYTVQRFRISGMRASIFEQYAKVIHGDSKKQGSILDLAKPLAGFMGALPDYTKKTRRSLSKDAQNVRSAFQLAKSPERLLFEQLPKALGVESIDRDLSKKQLSAFSERLQTALRELKEAYSSLRADFKKLLCHAFNIDAELDLGEVRTLLRGKCYSLENFTIDVQGLKPFLMRINKVSASDEGWLEEIMSFLAHKSPVKWLDSDHDVAEQRLADLSRRIIDLESLSLHEKRQASKMDGDFDVYLLRSVKKGGEFLDEVVAVDKKTSARMAETRHEIEKLFSQLEDRELVLSVLAEVSDRLLAEYKQGSRKTDGDIESGSKKKLLGDQ